MQKVAPELDAKTLQENIQQVLHHAIGPLTAKQVHDLLPAPLRQPPEELTELLEKAVKQGQLFRYAPYRSKAHRYWSKQPDVYLQEVIMELLNSQPMTRSELKTKWKSRLKDFSEKKRLQTLKQLIDQGQIKEWPLLKGRRSKRLSTQPPEPAEYLVPVFQALSKELQDHFHRLIASGLSRQAALDTAKQIFLSLPLFLQSEAPTTTISPPPNPAPTMEKLLDESDGLESAILEWMLVVEPAASQGALVSLPELRASLEFKHAGKSRFDHAVLRLAELGRLLLHRHDFPGSLREDQRAALVTDGEGRFYIGAMLNV